MPMSNTCTVYCGLKSGIVLTVQQTPANAVYPVAQPTTITLSYGSNSNIPLGLWNAWTSQEAGTLAGAGIPGFPSQSLVPPGPVLSGPNDLLATGQIYYVSTP